MLDHLPTTSRPIALDTERAPRGDGSRIRLRLRALGVELIGVAMTVALGLGALAHLVLTARSTVFFYSGDSVLMPLVERSIRDGEAMKWAMSSVLFVFPEIPVYAAIATVVPGVHAALMTNAIVTLVGLYGILRGLVAVVAPRSSRRTRVAVALVPIVALVGCSLLEHTAQRASLELVSLFLTTTYYYGTTLGMAAAIPLTVGAVVTSSSRLRHCSLAGLAALTALSTFSNPLFALWASAPIAVALVVTRRRGLIERRPALRVGTVAVAAALVGYLARIPMARYISIDITHYLRVDRMAKSIHYYVKDYFVTAGTWQGAIEMTVLSVAVTGTLVVAIIALVRRWPTRITLGLVIAACSIIVTVVAAIVLGTTASRYLMPLFFAPAAASVVLGAYVLERGPALTGLVVRWPSRRILMRAGAAAAVAVVALSIGAVRVVGSAPSTQPYAAATCLSNWIAGRDLTGAGRFWTMRALKAYGDPSVKLVQITSRYNATLWLDDAADFTGQEVSYLVVDSASHYAVSPTVMLGRPVQTITCGQYTVLDYQGTAGADILTTRIATSADEKIAARGL